MSTDGLDFNACPPVGPKGIEGLPGEHDVYSLLIEIANIDDEIARLNIDKLTKRSAELKKALKELMIAQKQDHIVDEVTGYTANITVRTNDVWDITTFKQVVTNEKYIKTQEYLVIDLIERAIKTGELSRAQLEVAGAVKKSLASLALYVKAPKKDET